MHGGALFAEWAGDRAADSLVAVPAAIEVHITEHGDYAHYAAWAMSVLAVLRLSIMLWGHDSLRLALHGLLALATLALLAYAADLGGALVYRYGVAVDRPAIAPPPAGPIGSTP